MPGEVLAWMLLTLLAAWLGIGAAAIGSWLRWQPCPREELGYRCHRSRASGCEECGRGRPEGPADPPQQRDSGTSADQQLSSYGDQQISSSGLVAGWRCVFDEDGRFELPPKVVAVPDVHDAALLRQLVEHVRMHTGRDTTVEVSVCAWVGPRQGQLLGWALIDPEAAPVWFTLHELHGDECTQAAPR